MEVSIMYSYSQQGSKFKMINGPTNTQIINLWNNGLYYLDNPLSLCNAKGIEFFVSHNRITLQHMSLKLGQCIGWNCQVYCQIFV